MSPHETDERERLIAAFTKVASEQGLDQMDLSTVARYAGVPAATFRRHFGSVEQALLAGQEVYFRRLWLDLEGACRNGAPWPSRIRSAVGELITALVESPATARLFAIEAPSVSPAAAERLYAAIGRLSAILRAGRELYPRAADLSEATERLLIGGAISLVCECLLAEDPEAISLLRPQLVEILLAPYLGFEEAGRVAAG